MHGAEQSVVSWAMDACCGQLGSSRGQLGAAADLLIARPAIPSILTFAHPKLRVAIAIWSATRLRAATGRAVKPNPAYLTHTFPHGDSNPEPPDIF